MRYVGAAVHDVGVEVRYTYRLRPGQTARRYLAREWGMCRYVWNALVAESADRYLWNQVAIANGPNVSRDLSSS